MNVKEGEEGKRGRGGGEKREGRRLTEKGGFRWEMWEKGGEERDGRREREVRREMGRRGRVETEVRRCGAGGG